MKDSISTEGPLDLTFRLSLEENIHNRMYLYDTG